MLYQWKTICSQFGVSNESDNANDISDSVPNGAVDIVAAFPFQPETLLVDDVGGSFLG